jgi:hypothetical protein
MTLKRQYEGVLKSIWPTMKRKGKIAKIFEDYKVFILFMSYELRTIKGDTLGELVKCKTLKYILKPKFPEKPDISGLQAGLQRLLPDVWPPAQTCPGLTLIPP